MTFTGSLLPYQPEAVDKMVDRKSMLVAYDLGLGKTVLTIAAIEKLREEGDITEPGLVICLSSLKYQWAAQIKKFTSGTATALVIDGTPKNRAGQYASAASYDYVILNYEQVVRDWDSVRRLGRGFIILDEATAIKSFKAKRTKAVKKLKSKVRFALTGTPIENGKPDELYSIMQFVDPTVLGNYNDFEENYVVRNFFGGVESYKNVVHFNHSMEPASVRKKQSDPDVSPFLPEKILKEPAIIALDKKAQTVYDHIADQLLIDLDEMVELYGANFNPFTLSPGETDNELRGKLMSKVLGLKLLCDHPVLLKESASQLTKDLTELGLLEGLTKTPKLDYLKEYVTDFLSEYDGNKVVIFTSYVKMVDLIREALQYESVGYTGRMDAPHKEASKLKFQEDPECRVFVSSDAGGYGVDLPQANLLINYDLPWSAGLSVQRNGRIMRASSTWEHVVIQDLLIRNSIEIRQHDMLVQKESVSRAILDGEGIDEQGNLELNLESLRSFIRNT
jgi:SNF2 family DNA or RNA helicase